MTDISIIAVDETAYTVENEYGMLMVAHVEHDTSGRVLDQFFGPILNLSSPSPMNFNPTLCTSKMRPIYTHSTYIQHNLMTKAHGHNRTRLY